MQRPQYPKYLDDFLAPGRWSGGLGTIMIVLIGTELVFLLTMTLTMPLFYSGDGDGPFPADTPLGTLLGFAIFGIVLVLFHALVWVVHKRGIETMLGPFKQCWFHYRRTLILVGILALTIATAPPFLSDADIALRRPFLSWLFFAALAVPIISIQAMTEEVIYRGYLMQQLAAYRPEKWIWIGIPSILFGSAHYFNGFGPSEGLFLAIWAACLGWACADLTVRTGDLGAAIGLHAVNNLYVVLHVGIEFWPTSGLALYLVHYVDPDAYDYSLATMLAPASIFDMILALLVLAMMWTAARIAVRR